MTPEQINRAIAELCQPEGGLWVVVKRGLFYRPGGAGYTEFESQAWKLPLQDAKRHEYLRGDEPVTLQRATDPNYHGSLDACAEFEEPMDHTQLSDYVALLIRELGVAEAITATAPQRCEAFLRLHGKWVEE